MTHYFHIVTAADPQALPRVLGIFAQRAVVPRTVGAVRDGDAFAVTIDVDALDPRIADIIAAKLDEAVLVLSVACDRAPIRAARASFR